MYAYGLCISRKLPLVFYSLFPNPYSLVPNPYSLPWSPLHTPTRPLDLKLQDRALFFSALVVHPSPLPVS